MRLHFPSVAVGVAAVSIILVSMSQAGPTVSPPRIEYGPNPRDMIQIREGTPYVVPPGRLLVVTALGSTEASCGGTYLLVNGQRELLLPNTASVMSVSAVPVGLTFSAGTTIELDDVCAQFQTGRAWGYLANQ